MNPDRTAPHLDPPQAVRRRPPRWRDPRLVLGIVIVTVSVLLGSSIVSSADRSIQVWALRHAVSAGAPLAEADLVRRRVRFADGPSDRYLLATGAPPAGKVLARKVGAGELLPVAAIGPAGPAAGPQVPLPVTLADLPPRVRAGSVVDVWVAPKEQAADQGEVRARRVLREVVVTAVPGSRDAFAQAAEGTVTVAVPGDTDLAGVLGATLTGRVVLTLRDAP